MEKNSIIYKQFYKKVIPLNEMSGLQWFALTENYGTSYGDLVQSYEFIQKPKLLDIGNGSIRKKIEETILPYDSSILIYSDPDEQYSGGRSNKMYHELLKKYFGDSFDGTIIDENHLESGEKYSKEDLEGPSEIVLWKDFSLLLREII
jgi:hypothetical protein